MKKSLFVLPMIALLAACGGGSKGKTTPTPGKTTPAPVTPTPSTPAEEGAEVDLFENKESLIKAANALGSFAEALGESEVAHLRGEVANGNLEVKANIVQEIAEGQTDELKLDLGVKNVGAKLDAAVTGYKFDGTEFSTLDLEAYAKVSDVNADLSLDYSLPDYFYNPDYYDDLDSNVQMIVSMLAQSGKLDLNVKGLGLAAYLSEGNLFVDASDEKIYTLADAILQSGLIPAMPAEMTTKQLISALLSLYLEAEEEVDFQGKIGVEGLVPEETTQLAIEVPDFSEMITDENFEEIKAQAAPILQAFGIKTYVYEETSKYSYGVEMDVNLSTIQMILTLTQQAEEVPDLETLFAAYGVTVNSFENKVALKLARDGGFELSLSLNDDIAVNVPEEALEETDCSSVTGSLKLSGQVKLSLDFDDQFDAFPSFEDYIMIPLKSGDIEPEPMPEPSPEEE